MAKGRARHGMSKDGIAPELRQRSARRLAGAVFVDRSGRRRRLVTLVGAGLGVLLVASLSILLAGLFSSGPVSIPGWPDAGARPGEGATPLPTDAGPSPDGTAPNPGTATAPPAPQQSPAAPGGQGGDHRRDPGGRPSKSPGKPG
ncbi:MAG TPA: hypothetical protein VFM55_21995 [Micromonosporaceae bacterium]|nr:hypothetical protein [Micromonosporaceae bacterium]